MKKFLTRHGEKIIGVLNGLDRVLFRGTLRQLAHVGGLLSFLHYKDMLFKDFGAYAEAYSVRPSLAASRITRASSTPRSAS